MDATHTSNFSTQYNGSPPYVGSSVTIRKILVAIVALLFSAHSYAQDWYAPDNENEGISLEELSILVKIPGMDDFYIDAIYASNGLLFVNIPELFRTVGIPYSVQQNTITGFIGIKHSAFTISYEQQQITVESSTYKYTNGLLLLNGDLYLESSLWGGTLGLPSSFNFRLLILSITPTFELPLLRERRLDENHMRLASSNDKSMADTTIGRSYHFLRGATLDWALTSNQIWKGATNNTYYMALGGEFLYGETNVSINYNDRFSYSGKNIYYSWRWVDNSKSVVRQAQLGRISGPTISYINSPIIGASIRNTPTSLRPAKGFYTINETTDPNWSVELYINGILTDYTKADASGAFTFKVPLVYGYTTLKLRYYGPLGEERTDERTMNVPYTIMPSGEFEYGIAGGVLEDSINSRFGRAEFNYGLGRFITLGGGVEYLSSIVNRPYIPFARATIQPFSRLTLSGEYDHMVKSKGLLDLYIFKNLLFELEYVKYKDGQRAVQVLAPEARTVRLSLPFRIKNVNFNIKADQAQYLYTLYSYYQSNIMLGIFYRQFSANTTSQINWNSNSTPNINSSLTLSYRFRKGLTIRPNAFANISNKKIVSSKIDIEQSFSRGFISTTYEHYFDSKQDFISINLRCDLSFARASMGAARYASSNITSQSLQGSIAFGGKHGYAKASTNPSVGKGAIVIYPFLDVNNNGIFDKDEHRVYVATVKIPGGKVIRNRKDSILRVTELTPFVEYMLELKNYDLENASWRFSYKRIKVIVDPNQFKQLYIPIYVVSEVNGSVYIKDEDGTKGLGQIVIKLFKKGSTTAFAEVRSEQDGFFSYSELPPGDYTAAVDASQLSTLDCKAEPAFQAFSVNSNIDGNTISGINFTLSKKVVEH